MDRESLLAQLELLLPVAADWARVEEERALREGIPLSEKEKADAKAIGVENPERIRLLRVEEIPVPNSPQLREATQAIRFLGEETRGLTLQYGIFVRWDCWGSRALILHELAHTMQYERIGGIIPFLRRYLSECLTSGYANSPLELEATTVAAERLAAV